MKSPKNADGTLRRPGSGAGTGAGAGAGTGGGRGRAVSLTCAGSCGTEEGVNPTGPGVASIRIRRQRVVWLCPECTNKVLDAVGIKLALDAIDADPTAPATPGSQ